MTKLPGYKFEAIGTAWDIELFDALPKKETALVLTKILVRIDEFDKAYSRFRSDSLVMRIASQAGTYTLPADAKALLQIYGDLYHTTQGAMTPLIGDTLIAAGYDAAYSLQPKDHLTTPLAWNEVMEYKHPVLITNQPVTLDFGAAGKGYLADIVGRVLIQNKLHNFCINAGGDIVYKSTANLPIKIALEHPSDPAQAIGIATINGGSLCGSAGNRRNWGKYHHIINPHTLQSPRHLLAVWVTAKTGILADALCTALYFVSPATLALQYNFEYALVHSDIRLEHSPGFPATFFH